MAGRRFPGEDDAVTQHLVRCRDLHDDTAVVTSAQRENLDRDGYARLRGLLAPSTITAAAPIIEDVSRSAAMRATPLGQRTVYQKAFLQELNLWQRRTDIRPLVFSTRIARAAADLLGVDGVRLYHDQALIKEAHGGRTPWHCDQYYWPLDTDRVITAWIPLHDVPAEMGPLSFRKASHTVDLGRALDISDESEAQIRRHPRWRDLPVDDEPFVAGDVSFHLGWTFHGAEPNHTAQDRLAMTMIYFADGTQLGEPTTDGQVWDRQIWLPDSEVGQPVHSWLNPLVWHRRGGHERTIATLPEADRRRLGTFTV